MPFGPSGWHFFRFRILDADIWPFFRPPDVAMVSISFIKFLPKGRHG
jgi:hypothetical protein